MQYLRWFSRPCHNSNMLRAIPIVPQDWHCWASAATSRCGPAPVSPLYWPGVAGAVILLGTVFERCRYKRLVDAHSGPRLDGYRRAVPRDPKTDASVAVFFHATSGERRYITSALVTAEANSRSAGRRPGRRTTRPDGRATDGRTCRYIRRPSSSRDHPSSRNAARALLPGHSSEGHSSQGHSSQGHFSRGPLLIVGPNREREVGACDGPRGAPRLGRSSTPTACRCIASCEGPDRPPSGGPRKLVVPHVLYGVRAAAEPGSAACRRRQAALDAMQAAAAGGRGCHCYVVAQACIFPP